MSIPPKPTLTRREAVNSILLTLGGAAIGACASSPIAAADAGGQTPGPVDATPEGDAAADDASHDAAAPKDTGPGGWASGGTKSMKGNYGDPFLTPATVCVLARRATAGPCTEEADRFRKDISEGFTGLPMRLALRVVDEACNPLVGANVKVWQTHVGGGYSGDTPNNASCLKKESDAAVHCFRGVQTTDANGRVDFDSCFPGWYPGRAIHVHYTVSTGNSAYTSQLVFNQALVDEIFASHPEYKGFGMPDTPNATDAFVGGPALATFVLDTSQMGDGALLASKQLVVRPA